MIEKKFTPGPWFTIFKGDTTVAVPLNGKSWDRCKVICDCRDRCSAPDDEDAANAQLIAAAPDLYDALEDLLQWALLPDPSGSIMPEKAALAALAKARGEA